MTSIERIQLSSVRLSESIGDELMQMIAAGILKPGQRLNEVQLATAFGVSRGPVREAARALEGQGVLISRPRQGFYVANYTAKELSDLYDVKQWLDQAMVEDYVTHGDTAMYREIEADISSIKTSGKMEFNNSLLAFRTRMTARLDNRFLAGQMLSLYRQLYIVAALLHTDHNDQRIKQIIGTLRGFWAAMIAGEADRAQTILRDDTRHWQEDVPPRFETAQLRD